MTAISTVAILRAEAFAGSRFKKEQGMETNRPDAANGKRTEKDGKDDTRLVFFIDKTRFEVTVTSLTARELLRDYAKADADQTSLLYKHAGEQHKFEGDMVVSLANGMHFSVLHNGPTTVS
ncbi:MAG TPA: hypothetical protein VE869_01570 [Gemmatimonas sp.]|nr:hypothetical protein [Gemmatimonas sp.]